jgi:hypothetical protein
LDAHRNCQKHTYQKLEKQVQVSFCKEILIKMIFKSVFSHKKERILQDRQVFLARLTRVALPENLAAVLY